MVGLAVEHRSRPSHALTCCLILGLSVGFLDLLLGLLNSPAQYSTLFLTASSLLITVLLFSILYFFLWFLIVRIAAKQLRPTATAISLAVFIATVFVIASLNNFHFELLPNYLVKLGLAILFCFGIAVLGYVSSLLSPSVPRFERIAVTVLLSLPFLLLEALATLELRRLTTGRLSVWLFPVFLLLLVALAVITLWIVHKYGSQKTVLKTLFVLLGIVMISPLITYLLENRAERLRQELKPRQHNIKHVILITIDTLRQDALSIYSPRGVVTPNIQKLANDGILYRNAVSPAPWTLPAFASILTGVSPLVHHATDPRSLVPSTLPTLPGYMYDNGYYTAAIGSNTVLENSSISRGFIEYTFLPVGYYESEVKQSFGMLALKYLKELKNKRAPSTEQVTQRSIRWIRENKDRDFFLWIHYFDPHDPYNPPSSFAPSGKPPQRVGFNMSSELMFAFHNGHFVPSPVEQNWIKQLYLSEVRYVDDRLGSVIRTLQETGIYDHSLIVLASDHGEEFWEHQKMGHGHSVYEELLRVPMLLKLPESTAKGEVRQSVTTAQIMPTILELCGISYPENLLSSGPLPRLNETHSVPAEPILSTGTYKFGQKIAVQFESKKYIQDLVSNREHLYDLIRDPQEQTSVIDSDAENVKKALSILSEAQRSSTRIKEHYKIEPGKKSKMDDETAERLKALGYIQ